MAVLFATLPKWLPWTALLPNISWPEDVFQPLYTFGQTIVKFITQLNDDEHS